MAEAGASTSGEIVEIEIDPLAELPRILDWLPEALIPLWEVVSRFPIVGALIVAAVAFLLALFVRFVIFHSLSRLASMTSSVLDDVVLEHLRKPVFTTVLYFGLALAVRSAQLVVGPQLIVKLWLSVIVASWMRALLRISTSLLHALEHQTRFSLVEARTVPMFDLSAEGTIFLPNRIEVEGWQALDAAHGIRVELQMLRSRLRDPCAREVFRRVRRGGS